MVQELENYVYYRAKHKNVNKMLYRCMYVVKNTSKVSFEKNSLQMLCLWTYHVLNSEWQCKIETPRLKMYHITSSKQCQ